MDELYYKHSITVITEFLIHNNKNIKETTLCEYQQRLGSKILNLGYADRKRQNKAIRDINNKHKSIDDLCLED